MDGGGGGGAGAKRRKTGSRDRHIPREITEGILLNLPVKSLLRFSSVSKSWNSIIFGRWFVKKYRGSENLVEPIYNRRRSEVSFLTLIPVVLSDNHATTMTTPLECPVEGKPYVCAFCDELLCVEVEHSLFLWNPCMRTYRKLRDPPLPDPPCRIWYLFELGYDAVGDDYKMLQIGIKGPGDHEVDLYSLRSDSWRKIQHFPRRVCFSSVNGNGRLVNGTLHWVVRRTGTSHEQIIIYFDLSTETYGEMAIPDYSFLDTEALPYRMVTLWRGKLCVCADYYHMGRLVMWTIENYGVVESWSVTLDISYGHRLPYGAWTLILTHLKESYDNGRILIKRLGNGGIFVSESDKPLLINNIFPIFYSCFLYVESLISPNMW